MDKNAFLLMLMDFRKDDRGGIVIFTLFVLTLMLVVGGMAVDFNRASAASARLQDTADRAALAATNLGSTLDPEETVEAYFRAAGLEDHLGDIFVEDTGDYRRVTVNYDYGINTLFLPFAGIDRMGGQNASSAVQGVASLEISLVLDVSASMTDGTRIETLREQAAIFAQTVLDEEYEGLVSMNVVPFAGNFDVGKEMFEYLNAEPYFEGASYLSTLIEGADTPDDLTDDLQYMGVPWLENLPYLDRLESGADTPLDTTDDVLKVGIPYLETLASGADTPNDRSDDVQMSFGPYCIESPYKGNATPSNTLPAMNSPQEIDHVASNWGIVRGVDWYCPIGAPVQYAVQEAGLSTTPGTLSHYLENLPLGFGTTSAESLAYGAALLNPASRPAFKYLNDEGVVPDDFADRPADYDAVGVQKVLIFMSDGEPFTLRRPLPAFDREYLNLDGLDIGSIQTGRTTREKTRGQAETAFKRSCTAIKSEFPSLTVITVAFEADEDSRTLLRECSSGDGSNAYIASEGSLGNVFGDIAKQVSELRVLE